MRDLKDLEEVRLGAPLLSLLAAGEWLGSLRYGVAEEAVEKGRWMGVEEKL